MPESVQRRADRILDRIAQEPLRGAWLATAGITVSVTVLAGLLMRLTDPTTFANVAQGLWWAVQTTTTVGYGDKVPQSALGKGVAALVMVVGIGFVTVSTAAIASAFVESSMRRRERAPGGDGARSADVTAELTALRSDVTALRRELRELRGEIRDDRAGGAS